MLFAAPLIAFSLLGSWTAVEFEQLLRWASGAVGLALAFWGGDLISTGMARRRWARRDRSSS